MERIARESARIHRQREAEQRRLAHEAERQRRYQAHQLKVTLKQHRDWHVAQREGEAEARTEELAQRVESLRTILADGLAQLPSVSLASLRQPAIYPDFVIPQDLATPVPAPRREQFPVKPPTLFERLVSRTARYEQDATAAENAFQHHHAVYREKEQLRLDAVTALQNQHGAERARRLAEIQAHNAQIDLTIDDYKRGEASAVVAYHSMVLEASAYPDGFPQEFRVAYIAESKELVIDYELPTVGIVPETVECRYVKSKDTLEEKPRKLAEIKELYGDIVASIALRTMYETVASDASAHILVVTFSGYINTVDPATGKDISPYLISVRVTRDRFSEIDLARVDGKVCLRNLGAQMSRQPAEMVAVKPIIEFDMVDKRFVDGGNILADLESRPNLMDLTPFEFETLVSNLFTKMGLDTKQTRSSRDGGVDAVAFDLRPVIGGKVVVQAKRYKHTVGVSAVRDLFGTMNHEGANKGILVTTSSFGPDAYDFIAGKPIELIDGGGLLYYLELAGIKARIDFPVEERTTAGL